MLLETRQKKCYTKPSLNVILNLRVFCEIYVEFSNSVFLPRRMNTVNDRGLHNVFTDTSLSRCRHR